MLLPITIELIQLSLQMTTFAVIVAAFIRFMGEVVGEAN